jgi:tetrapyrrole methylase family protein/MazG family protein
MRRLREIMDRLRGPDGCPWDREQNFETLSTYLLEETYEVLEALRSGSTEALREELGDLLFQIVFQARLAQEQGAFDIESLMKGIGDKIVRRHPHVFGGGRLDTAEEVLRQWEEIKVEERRGGNDGSILSGVPRSLPALLKALRISAKAARVGFDWQDRGSLWSKVEEETAELRRAIGRGASHEIAEELGDLLFTLANVARLERLDPELVLQEANHKFVERFRFVEERLAADGLRASPENRERMEALWNEAKSTIRRTSPDRTSPSGGIADTGPRAAPPLPSG